MLPGIFQSCDKPTEEVHVLGTKEVSRFRGMILKLLLLLHYAAGFDRCIFINQYRCGDICIDANKQCNCSGEIINYAEDWDKFCCTDGPGSCTAVTDKGYLGNGHGFCKGAIKNITESCRGNCHLEDITGVISYYDWW